MNRIKEINVFNKDEKGKLADGEIRRNGVWVGK